MKYSLDGSPEVWNEMKKYSFTFRRYEQKNSDEWVKKNIDIILIEDLWNQLQNSLHVTIGWNLVRQVESRLSIQEILV